MSTHQEHISGGKFNSSIKNLLRDYYTYGFKGVLDYVSITDAQMAQKYKLSEKQLAKVSNAGIDAEKFILSEEQMAKVRSSKPDDIESTIDALDIDDKIKEKLKKKKIEILKQSVPGDRVSNTTFVADWNRLNSILKDYAEWSEGRERNRRTFLTMDSQSMDMNPFQRVYRFSGEDRPYYLYYFFHSMSALSDVVMSYDEINALGLMKAYESFDNKQRAIVKAIIGMDLDESMRMYLLSLCDNTKSLLSAAGSLRISGNNYQLLKDIIAGRCAITQNNSCLSAEEIWVLGLSISKGVLPVERRIIRLVEAMDMDKDDQYQLLDCYKDSDALREVAKCLLLSPDRTLRLEDAISSTIKLKTSEILKIASLIELGGSAPNKTANNRLHRLERQGVAQGDQNPGKAGDLNGHLKWSLSPLTLKEVLHAGESVDGCFKDHILATLDFYSKTFLFGEIGMYLMDRLDEKYVSPIRIKHEYFMHALNDFNVIDLMYAIENKEWCLITYKRENIDTQLLVYPLEFRIGSTSGREYLMYYEPVKRSCTSLRLEFIESVQYYYDVDVRECLADVYPNENFQIDSNIEKSKLLLEYVWGVSTGNVHEKNVEKLSDLFKTVIFRVKYENDKDYYILNRLYRESRIGRISVNDKENYIEFSVTIADADELIPLMRGFYSRILSCTGIDEKQFSLEADIADMVSQYIPEKTKKAELNDGYDRKVWSIDEKLLNRLGDGLDADEHERIFNEVFSVQYHIFADLLGRIYNGKSEYTNQEMIKICKAVLKDHEEESRTTEDTTVSYRGTLINDYELLLKYLKDGGFLVPISGKQNCYVSKYYSADPINLYKDVVPLTDIEVRWLKTILEDDKIHYFLSDKEVLTLKLILAKYAIGIHPFPMHTVNYFDRYKFSEKKEWKESGVLNTILDAIRQHKVIKISNLSGNSKKLVTKYYKPILVEYSKRNNCFQGFFRDYREGYKYYRRDTENKEERGYRKGRNKGGIQVFNLAQIALVEQTEEIFDMQKARNELDAWRERQMTEVQLEFPDVNNIADRVLTQFSPWKKYCEFDSETRIYHLTIYYQKADARDIVTRFLGFGSEIRLIDDNHKLSRTIMHKLDEQMDLIKKPRVRTGERVDTVR